jgi:type II secretory ATPase GspE/PulE/Tfp pilus assembly ATPase PilB-like protein
MTLYRGAGCEKCRQTGYKGRLGIYEMMVMTDEMRDIVTGAPQLTELRRFANENGMRNLKQDGFEKASQGLTTIEEVMRVTEL